MATTWIDPVSKQKTNRIDYLKICKAPFPKLSFRKSNLIVVNSNYSKFTVILNGYTGYKSRQSCLLCSTDDYIF